MAPSWGSSSAEDLVGEDEEVDCPECGKECSGCQGLKTHLQMKHEGLDETSYPFLSKQEIHKEIASQWLGDESKYKTVDNITSVVSLPDEAMALIKTEAELEPEDADLLKNYGLTPEDTPKASVGDGVATVLVELARLARKLPGAPGSRIVEAYAKYSDDIPRDGGNKHPMDLTPFREAVRAYRRPPRIVTTN